MFSYPKLHEAVNFVDLFSEIMSICRMLKKRRGKKKERKKENAVAW